MVKRVNKPTLVTSAFIKKEGKFLLVFDPKFKFWRVPGGRANFGEKVEDALKREMKEEVGVDIKIIKFLGYGQDVVISYTRELEVSRFILFYLCEIEKGEIKPDEKEISEIKWLTLDEIKKHENLEPAMKDLFERNEGKIIF